MAANNRDLKNKAYETIKERLLDCTYEPGTLLNEARLAEDLGFSRTPVREAISRLESDGFVKIMPKKGIYVSDILLSDVLQIFQTRIEIEPVELIQFRGKFLEDFEDIPNSFRLDTAMHLFIIEYCGNRYIIDMMHRVFDDNTRVIIASKQNRVQIHDARAEHIGILDALLEKDVDKAQALMKTHVESCRRAALDYFYSLQAYNTTPPETYKKQLKDWSS